MKLVLLIQENPVNQKTIANNMTAIQWNMTPSNGWNAPNL